MSSILDNTSTMKQTVHRNCGGTILRGPAQVYCDKCGEVENYGEFEDSENREEAVEALQARASLLQVISERRGDQ